MIAKGKIMKIDIPTIYEEDIIEFTQRDGNVIFKYTADSIIEIIFKTVYKFDYVKFDYIRDLEWVFGLELQEDSSYMKNFSIINWLLMMWEFIILSVKVLFYPKLCSI